MKTENTYRNILKGISVFGGVQVFSIFINLLRGKFVAMFLGTVGMGISSLYYSSEQTIQRLASLGLGMAVAKDIAASKEDPAHLAAVMAVVRRLMLWTALAGAAVSICFSATFSHLAFGNKSHTLGFILLGAVIFFSIASDVKMSVLQGLHATKRLARASIVGSLTGLFVGVPLYFFFGYEGIVPAMIVLAFALWLTYTIEMRHELKGNPSVPFVWTKHKPLVRHLIMVGLVLVSVTTIGNAATFSISYLLRLLGSLADVGLYQGANNMTNQYSSVVFAALALDYLPRLAAVAKDNAKMAVAANRQTFILSMLIAPIAGLFILFAPLIVKILLTAEFEPIIPMLRLMAAAMVLKAFMFPLGYYTFAKNNQKVFFLLEGVFCNVLMTGLCVAGYFLFGLIGLGYAMILENAITYLVYYLVNRRLYRYSLDRPTLRAMLYALIIATLLVCSSLIAEPPVAYPLMSAVCLISIIYSIRKVRPLIRSRRDS